MPPLQSSAKGGVSQWTYGEAFVSRCDIAAITRYVNHESAFLDSI
jgi:hypothetical protein